MEHVGGSELFLCVLSIFHKWLELAGVPLRVFVPSVCSSPAAEMSEIRTHPKSSESTLFAQMYCDSIGRKFQAEIQIDQS